MADQDQKDTHHTEKKIPKFVDLKAVVPGTHGQNVYLQVVTCERSEVTKQDGTKLLIAEGTAGDHTGIINFRVVGENASKLKKDAVVAFRNLKSSVFNERHRLEIDLWGKISEEPTIKIEKINQEHKMSEIEYERKQFQKRDRGFKGGDRGGERRPYRGGGGDRGGSRRGRGGYNNRDGGSRGGNREGGYSRDRDNRDNRDHRDHRDHRDQRDHRDHRDNRDNYRDNRPKQEGKLLASISELIPGVHGDKVYVKIETVHQSEFETKAGKKLPLAEGTCGDSTGVIKFRVLGEYASIIKKDAVLFFNNLKSSVYDERHRLEISRDGKIEEKPDHKIEKINQTNKMSEIEYERKVINRDNEKGSRDRRN